MNADAVLSTHSLTVDIGDISVCDNLDLTISPGQMWAILGSNGAGKTTLLHTLAGLREPNRGAVALAGQAIDQFSRRQIAQRVGVLFQDCNDPYPATVLETVLIGRHPYLSAWQWENAADIDLATQALQAVGLDTLQDRIVDTLSGGERRRLAMATLLAQDPDIALLDEPLNHLDLRYQMDILNLLRRRVDSGQHAVMIILHDVNLAARFCDHAVLLHHGKVQQGPTSGILDSNAIEQLYGYPVHQVDAPGGRVFVPT